VCISNRVIKVYSMVEWKPMSSRFFEDIVYLLKLCPTSVLANTGDQGDHGASGTVLTAFEVGTDWAISEHLGLFGVFSWSDASIGLHIHILQVVINTGHH
jgi:hypothetical protein